MLFCVIVNIWSSLLRVLKLRTWGLDQECDQLEENRRKGSFAGGVNYTERTRKTSRETVRELIDPIL